MKRKISFAAICTVLILMLSACVDDRSRLIGDWTGATGGTARRYEFNSDGTGAWGDGRNAATEAVWNANLGRYVMPWIYHVLPATWVMSGNTIEITLTETGTVFVHYYEFLDDDTLVLTRENQLTGLELMRVVSGRQ